MKVLIIADSHDHVENLNYLFNIKEKGNYDAVIHCGDLVNPSTLDTMKDLEVPRYYVLGNNEGEDEKIGRMCNEYEIIWFFHKGEFEIDGRSFAITHYPRVAESLRAFGEYSLVCFGHSHRSYAKKYNNGWLVNPGSIGGFRQEARYALYDTEADTVEIRNLDRIQKSYSFE